MEFLLLDYKKALRNLVSATKGVLANFCYRAIDGSITALYILSEETN